MPDQGHPELAHPELVSLSIDRHVADLNRLDTAGWTGSEQACALQLFELLQMARERGIGLVAADFEFRGDQDFDLTESHRLDLVNQYCLGFGNDGARVVFMGTEEGYTVEAARFSDLAIGNFAYAVSWATGGKDDVLAKIGGKLAGTYHHSLYHRHAYDYGPVAGTWAGMTRCISSIAARPRDSWFKTVSGIPRLGDLAYVIDRSGLPSKTALKGSVPTAERQAFIEDVIGSLRNTAEVLVITGSTGSSAGDDWDRVNTSLTNRFLGSTKAQKDTRRIGQAMVRRFEANRRRVLWTWGLGGSAPLRSEYFPAIREWIDEPV